MGKSENDVERIAAAIKARPDGQLALSPADFASFAVEMGAWHPDEAVEKTAIGLLTVAKKSERLAPENTRTAVAQIGVLLAILLRDVVAAERAMTAARLRFAGRIPAG